MIPHVSASQIKTFRDCPRKWYLQKVVKLPSPSTAATELGGQVHAELEAWLRDGKEFSATLAGEIAKSGAHLVPTDRHVEIELSLAERIPISDSPVKVVGFIDALYPYEPAMILDHKTSSNKRYTKTARELAHDVQLTLYAKAYLDHAPDVDEVTLTHVYYGTRGAPWSKRVDAQVTRDHVETQWAQIRATIEEMIEVSHAQSAADAPPSYDSCDKYGGCPYAGECFHADKQRPPQTENNETENDMTPAERLAQLGLAEPTAPKTPKPAPKTAKPTTPAPKSGAPKTRILYIGCTPIKGASNPPTNAVEAFTTINARLCAEFKVPHLGLVDYGRGWAAYSGAIASAGWPNDVSALYLDPLCQEYERLVSPLSELADVIIRRL